MICTIEYESHTLPLKSVGDKGAYIGAVIDALSPNVAPVLVSPSMSGGFAVPFLADTPEKVKDPSKVFDCSLPCAGVRLGASSAGLHLPGSRLFPGPLPAHHDCLRGAGPQPGHLVGRQPQAHPNLNAASSFARGQAPRLP